MVMSLFGGDGQQKAALSSYLDGELVRKEPSYDFQATWRRVSHMKSCWSTKLAAWSNGRGKELGPHGRITYWIGSSLKGATAYSSWFVGIFEGNYTPTATM